MSRKHFTAIAEAISRIENPVSRKEAAYAMASVCAESNGRFDRARFLRACGVE